ncbi:hypothetical protein PHMEG_00022239 [Phytophthora megakarya]|uniref:Uncharacterized protein n=1 Tax=Phytophthora megakarya TaxID=4795 RepID=A0A225VLB0_9STRA|nr:hypothetical protein PHMEG_00022239 [Phytophthora megakarya]
MGDRAEVIVPGHGVCTLHLADDASTYIPDNVTPCCKADQAQNVHTLTLKFFQVEHPTLVTNLLSFIGSNLRSLTMGIYWTGRRCRISLDRVAAGCPRLEELYLTDFDVEVSSSQELKNWGLKKLFIQSCEEMAGLTECLSDPANRMSLELEELEIRIPRSNHIAQVYLDALTTCNDEYIAVVEKELPLECKSAVVSVVECGDCESLNSRNSNPIHQLNETLMGIIFSFAATPMRRTVRIISL